MPNITCRNINQGISGKSSTARSTLVFFTAHAVKYRNFVYTFKLLPEEQDIILQRLRGFTRSQYTESSQMG